MENAAKALIMAGGMLIGIIVLTIAVYLFTIFGSTSQNIQEQIDSRVVAEFNNNFLKSEGSNTIPIPDIVSLANFAKKSNEDYNLTYADDKDNEFYVEVYLNDAAITASKRELTTVDDYIDIIKLCSVITTTNASGESETNVKYYTCTIDKNSQDENARVKKITFSPAQ